MPFLDDVGLQRVWSKIKSLVASSETNANSHADSAVSSVVTKLNNEISARIKLQEVTVDEQLFETGATAGTAIGKGQLFFRNKAIYIATKAIAKGNNIVEFPKDNYNCKQYAASLIDFANGAQYQSRFRIHGNNACLFRYGQLRILQLTGEYVGNGVIATLSANDSPLFRITSPSLHSANGIYKVGFVTVDTNGDIVAERVDIDTNHAYTDTYHIYANIVWVVPVVDSVV